MSELSSPIIISNNNWIGNKSTIMKGSVTLDFCIIAGGSLINKRLDIPNFSIAAGVPVRHVKEDVYRVLLNEEKIIKKHMGI